ncbi:T9SS type A sorting domain-containing protein [candidate division KSB1 bacterium]|nr:T9SS type A sorting domain-containing protein [candidate division KSB1 bacterium]
MLDEIRIYNRFFDEQEYQELYQTLTGVEDFNTRSNRDQLLLPFPNPFHHTVTLSMPKTISIRTIKINNIQGQCVRTLEPVKGSHEQRQIIWDGRDDKGIRLPSSVYLITITTAQEVLRHKVLLLR